MVQDKKTPISIDDVEYIFEDMTQEQQLLFNYCVDLDHKINSAQFNLGQLNIGKRACINMLKDALTKVDKTPPVVATAS